MAILAITKSHGSGGSEIGRKAADLLDYEFISLKKILDNTKQAGGVWERFVSEYANEYPTIWDRNDWSFMGFMALLQSVILNYAEQDNKVIMARGACALLKDIPHALRIRVTAPVEFRIQEVVRKEEQPLKTARLIIQEADRAMQGTMSRLYGEDWNAPENFELKFDTSRIIKAEIVEDIRKAIVEKEKLNTAEARRQLHLCAVAAQVKAGIATNPKVLVPTLEVKVDGNVIKLSGVVHSPREQNMIEKEAIKLALPERVTFAFNYRGSW